MENCDAHVVWRDESSQETRDAMLKRMKNWFLRFNMERNFGRTIFLFLWSNGVSVFSGKVQAKRSLYRNVIKRRGFFRWV